MTIGLKLMLPIFGVTLTLAAQTKEELIEQVRDAEIAFAELAAEAGLKAAFLAFADDDAVINRGNQIHRGKAAIAGWFDHQTMKDVSLVWEPDFIDVSDDGTLAYTYGPFSFRGLNADGEAVEFEGIFHTVWKRQPDGSWKFVYD